jgi:hypothetical protein
MLDAAPRAQADLLHVVLRLARAQHDALQREDLDQFEAAIARREALLRDADAPATLTDDDASTLEVLVQQILDQDRANESALATLMASIQGEMPALAKGQQANAAYRMSERSSTFINRVS